MSRFHVWKSISKKEEHYNKGKILNGTLEQLAYAGNGDSHSGLWNLRPIHFGNVRLCGLHRDGGYRGGLLNGCRMAFGQAVCLAKENRGRPEAGQAERYRAIHLLCLQYCLLGTDSASFHPGNGLPYWLHYVLLDCRHQGHCQRVQQQLPHTGAGRALPPANTLKAWPGVI